MCKSHNPRKIDKCMIKICCLYCHKEIESDCLFTRLCKKCCGQDLLELKMKKEVFDDLDNLILSGDDWTFIDESCKFHKPKFVIRLWNNKIDVLRKKHLCTSVKRKKK